MANRLISNLSGGMNNKTSPLLIKDNEAELIINYNLDKSGALTKRNGFAAFATQMVAGNPILGMHQYTNSSTPAETTQVAVINNSGGTNAVIYYNASGTWATSKTDDTAASGNTDYNRTRFATFLDYLFRVNGVQVVATSINVNGSSWGTTNAPATITPAFISVFQDRVYLARNGATLGSRVYFSELPSGGSLTWDTTNDFFDINPDDGDQITGLENNGNRLLIFKSRSMYRWTFGQTEPDRLIGVGTDSQECIKTNFDLGITFFANQKGVYAYDGDRPRLISRKIQSWFDVISSTSTVNFKAEVDADHYYLYIGDNLSFEGKLYSNVMFVYTISLDAWVIYSLGEAVSYIGKFINANTTDGESIYFGNTDGKIRHFGVNQLLFNYLTDAGTAIQTEFVSKEYLLSFPQKTTLNYVDVIALRRSTTSVQIQTDRENDGITRVGKDFPSLGETKERFSTYRFGKECRTARLRLSEHSSVSSIIEGFNFDHNPKPERKP